MELVWSKLVNGLSMVEIGTVCMQDCSQETSWKVWAIHHIEATATNNFHMNFTPGICICTYLL